MMGVERDEDLVLESSDPLGGAQRTAEHGVTLADRGDRERLAHVRCAPLVAGVRPGCAVLDEGAAVAATAARPEFRLELLEGSRSLPAQLRQGSGAECRTDEAVDQQLVASPVVSST